jgi:hypothetical protein
MLSRTFLILMTMASIRFARAFARDISRTKTAFRPLVSSSLLLPTDYHAAATHYNNEKRHVHHKAVARDSLAETSKTGEFQRRESAWRNWISRGNLFFGSSVA